jgi:hypothetical protein
MRALVCVVVAVLMTTACGAANATTEGMPSRLAVPGATFSFKAEDGAHPVGGRTGDWVAPASEIMVWENENILKIDAEDESGFDFIRVELNAPGHAPLDVGDYPGARDQDSTADVPGMLVISNGLACGDVYGEFVIDRIQRDPSGKLTALDAGFTQRCGAPDSPALHGRIHFQS